MCEDVDVHFSKFKDETQLDKIMALIAHDLSEPYSIYVYRYFIQQWPDLCFLAHKNNTLIGAIIAKLEKHRSNMRGYIAMLAVQAEYRGQGIATELVDRALAGMMQKGADEICLETETTNHAAMSLYYLNAGDAIRFILPIKHPAIETDNIP